LRELAMRHPEAEIVIGTDRDVAGDRIARIIVERIGERSRVRREAPISKDWNENLQVRKAEATRKALTTLARNNRSMILSP
jgi:5S rRNA maturation endonuclease (ribonuclease M5)